METAAKSASKYQKSKPDLDEVLAVGGEILVEVSKDTRAEFANYERAAGGLRIVPIYDALRESVSAKEARRLAEVWRDRPEGLETYDEGAGEISYDVLYAMDALRYLYSAYQHAAWRVLQSYRAFGSGTVPSIVFERGSRREAKDAIERAADIFPADWLLRSARAGPIKATLGERGVYRSWAIPGYPDGEPLQPLAKARIRLTRTETYANAVHELAHRAQDIVPYLARLEEELYVRRTTLRDGTRTSARRLPGYRSDDLFREGDFFNSYVGRDPLLDAELPSPCYELVPCGLEALFGNDLAYFEEFVLYDDAEHETFCLGVLALL